MGRRELWCALCNDQSVQVKQREKARGLVLIMTCVLDIQHVLSRRESIMAEDSLLSLRKRGIPPSVNSVHQLPIDVHIRLSVIAANIAEPFDACTRETEDNCGARIHGSLYRAFDI